MTLGVPLQQAAVSGLSRAAMRRELLARRELIAPFDWMAYCARIENHLAAALLRLPPTGIGFCAPIRREFDARPLLGRLHAEGWATSMPVVELERAPMRFRPWAPDAPMKTDRHGIATPLTDQEAPVPAILLLPLVGFDAAGFRLGYGGGYFDRTLASVARRPFALGVGFDCCRVHSIDPQPHDIPCDAVVTDAGWFGQSIAGDPVSGK